MIINLKTILNDFLNLIFPNCCVCCSSVIEDRSKILCTNCFNSIHKTNYHMNPSSNHLFGMLHNSMTIENAFSMFFFEKNTAIQKYMHYFKYKRHNEIGIELGEMYAKEIIKNKNLKNKFDIIIPIPLHKKKYEERGYNQSEMFAIGLNKIFNIEVDTTSVIRIKNTKSQTFCKDTKERFSNVKDAFKIIIPEKLNNKHILLVDDLITAGATMISCVSEIKSKCNCKISICSICRAL